MTDSEFYHKHVRADHLIEDRVTGRLIAAIYLSEEGLSIKGQKELLKILMESIDEVTIT